MIIHGIGFNVNFSQTAMSYFMPDSNNYSLYVNLRTKLEKESMGIATHTDEPLGETQKVYSLNLFINNKELMMYNPNGIFTFIKRTVKAIANRNPKDLIKIQVWTLISKVEYLSMNRDEYYQSYVIPFKDKLIPKLSFYKQPFSFQHFWDYKENPSLFHVETNNDNANTIYLGFTVKDMEDLLKRVVRISHYKTC